MNDLNERERELVIISAAIASNCIPCIEKHIPVARAAGLSEAEIGAAIKLADVVRQKPAGKVLETANGTLSNADSNPSSCTSRAAAQCACC